MADATGPDFKVGIDLMTLSEDTPLLGHFDDEAVVLIRKGDEVFAISATCTHYSGPLAEGLVVDYTIRCPWHHARFDVRTGEADGAPALDPVACFNVVQEKGKVRIDSKKTADFHVPCPRNPSSVVIVGAGAAGAACADKLRAKGYTGPITLSGDEEPGPVDRPNLSKDYLEGTAQEEWIPLRTRDYYKSIEVELITGDPAVRLDTASHHVSLKSGRALRYDSLLLATGAEPQSLPVEGASLPHVHRLRTLGDSKAIVAHAERATKCAIIGSSFIGLEVAASLRQRKLDVTVIGRDSVPLAKILGPEVGRFIQSLHEQHGVRVLMNAKVQAIREERVELGDGQSVEADLVVLGVGVSPRVKLAEAAGLNVDNGVVVNESLQTSAEGIYAAGDIACYPNSLSSESARIEHWVMAERQGQAVAREMLGIGKPFREVPFFWTKQYDVTINYSGHAAHWDSCEIRGSLEKHDACVIYRQKGKVLAVATIDRDHVSLEVEAAMEQGDTAKLEGILKRQ